jgi:cell division protein YceG involved in septum cleavage
MSEERTEAERERAREERERRRLQKAGAGTPPLPPPLAGPELSDTAPSREPIYDAGIPAVESELAEPTYVPSKQPPVTPAPLPARGPAMPAPLPARQPPVVPAPLPAGSRLRRPHLYGKQARGSRKFAARAGIALVLIVVLGAIGFGAVRLSHHSARPKIPPIPKIVKIVIPEGFTRAQIAVLAHRDGLSGSYLLPSKHSSEIDFAHYGAPTSTPNLEGFLFPATYEMYVGAPASQLVSEQLSAFRENFGGGEVDRARALGITQYQLLIVASIIEREAAIPHDRRLVAAVIYNRLRLNMTLGIDSTLRYALRNFSTPLTEAELHSDSPYNTRTHTGLPPTPISNPGVAAIQAAAHPAHVSYLYYVAGADGCGEEVFSTSYAQFEKNAAAYREAIAKNGGRVPACDKKG